MNKYKFVFIALFCVCSTCALAQKEEEVFDEDDINAYPPVAETHIEIVSCDESTATVRVCNDGVENDPNYKGLVTVIGFSPANLIEALPKEDVVFDPGQDGELEYEPRETPADRMETEFLGKYEVPKNIHFKSDSKEILPDQCVDVTFNNVLEPNADFGQKDFSCDTPITVTLGVDMGGRITHKIDFENMRTENEDK